MTNGRKYALNTSRASNKTFFWRNRPFFLRRTV